MTLEAVTKFTIEKFILELVKILKKNDKRYELISDICIVLKKD